MGQRLWSLLFSAVVFVCSITAIATNGLNFGLDFTGGTQIQVRYDSTAHLDAIRMQLSANDFDKAVVQAYGTSQDVLIRLAPLTNVTEKSTQDTQENLKAKIIQALPGAQIQRVEFIGPQVGKTLVTNGLLAILISLIATMIYIAVRFEYRFAISAIISLIHDPILILGVFALFHIEFNLVALAALLTILGYSLNDTIVVYDRVRENFRKMRKATPIEVMNLSVNQTLSRTIMTSGLTLLVVIALLLFGGETLMGFSVALIIGILIGTYSSIYIAGSLALWMGLDKQSLVPAPKKEIDDRP